MRPRGRGGRDHRSAPHPRRGEAQRARNIRPVGGERPRERRPSAGSDRGGRHEALHLSHSCLALASVRQGVSSGGNRAPGPANHCPLDGGAREGAEAQGAQIDRWQDQV
ncbi:unnamed protein product [Prorocentrum cordatum]|nr:unnamed protein product [Polarella glacialis]